MQSKSFPERAVRATRKIHHALISRTWKLAGEKKKWGEVSHERRLQFKYDYFFKIHCFVARRLVADACSKVPLDFKSRDEFIRGFQHMFTINQEAKEDGAGGAAADAEKMSFHIRWAGQDKVRTEFVGAFFSSLEQFYREIDAMTLRVYESKDKRGKWFTDFMHAMEVNHIFYRADRGFFAKRGKEQG